MTEEKIELANSIKRKIDKLDYEINILMELLPPIRHTNSLIKGKRGWIQKIRSKNLIQKRPGLEEREIELSNEDIRALTDIRAAERAALHQVLNEL